MRQRGILSYDRMIEYLYKRQAEKWSEAIYNEDGYFKYEQPLIEGYLDYSQSHENPQIVKTGAYLYALQGSRELYRQMDMEKPLPVSRQQVPCRIGPG